MKVRVLFALPLYNMKVTIENKKGLSKDLKVIVDKKTMDSYLEERYEEIRKILNLNKRIFKRNMAKLGSVESGRLALYPFPLRHPLAYSLNSQICPQL